MVNSLKFIDLVRKINTEHWLLAFDKYLKESDGSDKFDISYVDNAKNEIQNVTNNVPEGNFYIILKKS